MKIRQPRLRRSDQPVRDQCAVVPCEIPNDRAATLFLPRKAQTVLRKFICVGDINRRREGYLFPDPIWPKELSDLDNCGAAGLEILNCNRAVAGSQIDPEAETCADLISGEFRGLGHRFHGLSTDSTQSRPLQVRSPGGDRFSAFAAASRTPSSSPCER